jgi:hypothetical protein
MFTLTVAQVAENFESGDFNSLSWTTSGDQDWFITSSAPYEGIYCSQSGSISHYDSTRLYISLAVVSDDTISFYYKVSSENNWDYLRFLVDGIERDKWSGDIGWTEFKYPVSAGAHSFEWKYTKDGSLSNGSDCAWIDQIIFPPIAPAPIINTETLPDWTQGVSYSQQLDATGGTGELSWADKNNDLDGTGLSLTPEGLLSGIPASAEIISFIALVTDEASGSAERQFSFIINPIVDITTDLLPDAVEGEPYSYQLLSTGGTGTISWSDKNAELTGTGLALSSSGLLSGTVAEAGSIAFTARAQDAVSASDEMPLNLTVVHSYICGDANGNDEVEVGDAVFVINYVFKAGSPPNPGEAGDANCDENVNVGDAVYVINYVFKAGTPPCCP